MIETLLTASIIIGQAIVGPNLIQTDYLNQNQEVVTIVEPIQEVR